MKEIIKIVLIVLTALMLFYCSSDTDDHWTIMVYMAADNDLTEQAVQDIIEMEKAVLPSKVNLIVQLDPNEYHTDPQARRYEIHHNNLDYISSPVVKYLGNIDSGDYMNLADFVNWSINKYPADKYALFIWSHGTGWTRSGDSVTRGICPDQTHLNQISIANGELRQAFKLYTENIDIVAIDACLMFTLEVLTEIYQYCDYVIGSENLMPQEGFPYREIFDSWQTRISSSRISSRIVELFLKSHLPGGSQNPHDIERQTTISVMDSDKLPTLLGLIENFVIEWTGTEHIDYIREARERSYSFHIAESEVDIKEFFSQLKDVSDEKYHDELQTIINMINSLFVGQGAVNLPDNTGTATVWYPQYVENLHGSGELYSNLLFARKTQWVSLLERVLD